MKKVRVITFLEMLNLTDLVLTSDPFSMVIFLALGLFITGIASSVIRDDMKYIFYAICFVGSGFSFLWLAYETAIEVVETSNGVKLLSPGLAAVFAIVGLMIFVGTALIFWWKLKQPFNN